MRYLSVCSGIEAASVAWAPLGFSPVAFAEVEPFPCAVLAERWPGVPNLGDIRKIDGREMRGAVDVVVGGTPCQGFSVAGHGRGLDDERSGLALHFVRIVSHCRPQWIVWENVTGSLSTNGGRSFGTFVRALDQCGYYLAWRVLDAQFFGTPQRRRRLFIVGHHRDWRRSAAILFEREGVRGNTPQSGKKRPDVVGALTSSAGCNGADDNSAQAGHLVVQGKIVRRLAPVEWERLMGFPDHYTRIAWRGKSAENCPDAPRYKALGNSMAVPVMRWLGKRILMADKLMAASVEV